MQILLIDDEIRKAEAIVSYFREVCDWAVEIAPGPDQAIELLKARHSHPYDLIILDIMMDPGTVIPREKSNRGRDTGLILLKSIRELTDGKTPVVLYTARTDLDYLKDDNRVAAYVQKPRTAKDLAREIEDVMEQQGGSNEAR